MEYDESKFEEIYYKYREYMLYIAYTMAGNSYDSEDIVHDTFLDFARNFKAIRIEDDGKLLSYLICATRGHAINYLKRKKPTEQLENYDYVFSQNSAGWDTYEETVEYDYLVSLIRNLHSIYSDPLYLYYVGDYSYKEVAKILGRNQFTVRKQIERGKRLLIEAMKKEGVEYE